MKSAFFDLDGTLLESHEGITKSIKYAIEKLGHSSPSLAQLRTTIGQPLWEVFPQLLGTDERVQIERAVALYRERFESKGIYENAVFPGVPEMLQAVKHLGLTCYIVTSKPTQYAKRLAAHFSLSRFFTKIYGSHLDGEFSKKADLIRHALKEETLDPKKTVMVGDRASDIRGALNNGLTAIGVTYGYGTRRELEAAGATWICDSPSAVTAVLITYQENKR